MPMFKRALVALLVLLAAAGFGAYFGTQGAREAAALDAGTADTVKARENLVVYVTGAVNKPGVVSLPEGARASDAVEAAGGVLPIADTEKINLAQPLKDGQKLEIPEKHAEGVAAGTAKGTKSEAGELININTADEKALDTLPGIGPAMAQRIIEYREKEGAFQDISELKKVRGIGEAKFEKLKDKVTI